MKSQVDVALLIGSIIIPSAALLGSLIFAFTLLGPLTDAARLAAVISHDAVTLVDVVYSVPGDIEVHYKPPSSCRFVDIKNPYPCTSKPIICERMDYADCNTLYGCKWDSTNGKCISFCSDYDGDEVGCNSTGVCTWNSEEGTCVGANGYYNPVPSVSQCDPEFDTDGNLVTDCCKEILDETTCENVVGCSWSEPVVTGMSCLNGFMNITQFDITIHYEKTKMLGGIRDFPHNTEVSFPAVLRAEYLSRPLLIPYPGYVNILDKGFTNWAKLLLHKEGGGYISIRKMRNGIFDTIGYTKYKVGPITDIANMVRVAIKDENNMTGSLFLPQMYFTNYTGSVICLSRVAQSPDNIIAEELQEKYAITCFDLDLLNDTQSEGDFYISVYSSFDTQSDYLDDRTYKVYVNLTCLCDKDSTGWKCDNSVGRTCGSSVTTANKPYCCSNTLSSIPKYDVELYLVKENE
ncbi:MAG: hypothetical protein J7K73_03760 [Nanoarchaeota archaeon]|nr:hypothetical protein [Nanoarchaeota archaeon]